MVLEILEELGLTKSEIKTYLALLELGQSTTGPVVDKAKIASSKIYEILDKLCSKGLVSYVLKGKVKYFEATQPERILNLLKEKEELIEKQRKEIERILPELTRKKELSKIKEKASIYRGFKGLEITFYEALDLMKKTDMMYVIGIPSRTERANRFFIKFSRDRAKRGIVMKALFNEKARGELQTIEENTPLTEMKFMPEGITTPAAVNVLGNRTIIFPAETSEEPLLIVIENKEIADSFRTQFNLLWNQQTIILTDTEGPVYVLKDIARTLKKGEEDLVFGIEADKIKEYPKEALKEYFEAIEKKGIKELVIIRQGTEFKASPNSTRRYLPKEYFTPMHYEIYGNKVAMINWTAPITTVVTENKAMANSFRIYFHNLWKISKEKPN